MAVDMFMSIDDIKGESVDNTHKDKIQVLSWNWGMTQAGSAHTGAGTGTGKVSVRDLKFTKYVDRATPLLMKYCCKGKFFDKATLFVRKAGDAAIEYVKLELQQGLVSSVESGGADDNDRLLETITLNFKSFRIEYTPQKDGKAAAIVPAGWDIAKNAEV